jgi:hypothetical protein
MTLRTRGGAPGTVGITGMGAVATWIERSVEGTAILVDGSG